jgi:hypothetical protein
MSKENIEVVTEVKPVNLGEFKSKRKFLSFISGVNGARVRFNRDIAFLKGEKLSGMLEGAIFKITICDEGTLNFEEVDTKLSDAPMRQRLIDDIDSMDVTGYTQKYVVAGLEFADVDGNRCYLEVEEAKPIDKLRLLFGDDEEVTPSEKTEISERGLSILDQLFGSNEEEDNSDDEYLLRKSGEGRDFDEEEVEEVKESKLSYMEEQFRKMNEDKITELKSRIEDAQRDIRKYESDIKNAETNKKKVTDSLGVLETRLETLTPGDEPNGYVFFVSEQKKNIEGLNDDETKISGKIADLMNLKKDVLVKHLTEGFYKIKIAKKDDFKTKLDKVDKDILEKIDTIDVTGKLSMSDTNEFEYRGELNWHQLVSKMLRKGFEQEPEFDMLAGSNSYESKEEVKEEVKEETETTLQLKGKEVRTFDKETTLVIVGDYNDDSSDFSITDDETEFGVYIGDKEHSTSYESDGFVSILTLDEFKNWRKKIENNGNHMDDILGSSFLIPDFKGTIGVTAKTSNNEFTTDFYIEDYICHQVDNCYDVYLTLPEGTTIIEMENHEIPLSVLRDLKIDKIIE